MTTGSPPLVLRFPAEARYASVARTAAAAVASRLQFGVDRIEDLRLAVGELVALAAGGSAADAQISLRIAGDRDGVQVTAEFPSAEPIPEDGFAWLVLSGLSGDAVQWHSHGLLTVQLSVSPVVADDPGAGAAR
jgi:serine/threonine-protein kinase RsbW